jgi:hypothetical protein
MFPPLSGASLVDRMIGVAKLDIPTYEAIKRDGNALGQAALVVLLSAIATNVWVAVFAPRGIVSALGGIVLAFLAWLLFAALVWWLGRTWFTPRWAPPDFGQLLRLTGFATAPNLLNIFGFVPVIGWLVLMIASIWALVCAYTAVRVGLATNERHALLATFIAYVANALLFALAAGVLGIGRGGFLPMP